MHRGRADHPLLITTAPRSNDDEYDQRRKKYAIMMAGRALAVVLAACTYRVSIWLALGLVIAGAILPWCAVLIANDRPPKRRRQVTVGRVANNAERALPPAEPHRTIDG